MSLSPFLRSRIAMVTDAPLIGSAVLHYIPCIRECGMSRIACTNDRLTLPISYMDIVKWS